MRYGRAGCRGAAAVPAPQRADAGRPLDRGGATGQCREMAQYAREHAGWTGVYVEFWTHASRRAELRAKVAEQDERLVETVGGLVATWAGRWGVELALPAREVVRGIYAISRGLGLETLLADESRAPDQFEEMFLAYVTCLRTRR